MSFSNSTIKTIAKNILSGNYIHSMIATVIVLSVMFMCNNVAAVFSYMAGPIVGIVLLAVFCIFLFLPMCIGLIRYFWRLSCGVKDNPISVFYYFSSKKAYFKTMCLILPLLLRVALCMFVFCVPVFVAELIASSWLYSVLDVSIPIWTVNLTDVINILKFIAILATLFSSFKFYLAPMLFVADENMDASEALHLSTVISKRTLLDFIFFLFSFSGWILLSLIVIPLIFTLPYFITSYLIHSSAAVDAFNESIAKINHDDIPTYIAGA